jgi:hypothetical protein
MSANFDTRRVQFRPIYTNSVFGLRFAVTLKAGETFTFTGQPIKLLLDPVAPATRVTLDSTVDPTAFIISNGGLTLDVYKAANWTATTLAPGEWTFTLFVGSDSNRIMVATGSFRTITPPRGAI